MDSRQAGLCLLLVFCSFGTIYSIPTVQFTSLTLDATEGTTARLQVARSPTDDALVLTFSYTYDTAIGSDVSEVTTLNIGAGDMTAYLDIPIINDNDDEPDEVFKVNIDVSASNYNLQPGKTEMTVTILRSDQPTFSLQAGAPSEDAATFTVTIKSDIAVTEEKIVDFTIGDSGSTATGGGVDYTEPNPLSVTFANTEIQKTFDIQITDDDVYEGLETFVVTLTPNTKYLTGSAFTYTIADNDLPVFYMKDARLTVGEADLKVTLTVKRDQIIGGLPAITVKLGFSDDTATGADYVNADIDVPFAVDELEKTVEIAITDDEIEEIPETFDAEIKTDAAYSIGNNFPKTTVTITSDDKSVVSMKEDAVTFSEEISTASVVLTRAVPSGGADTTLAVTLDVSAMTATEGSDYMAPNTFTVTFPASANDDDISYDISLINDDLFESDKMLKVTLQSDPGFTRGSQTFTIVTITSEDAPIFKFGEGTTSINEGSSSSVDVILTNQGSSSPVITIELERDDETATETTDYTVTPTSLSFSEATSTVTVQITTVDDQIDEPEEEFSLSLSGTGIANGNPSTVVVTILDNDNAKVAWNTLAVTKTESDGDVAVELLRTDIESNSPALSVTIAVAPGSTAVAGGTDVTLSTLSLNFAEGSNTASTTVTIVDDEVDEPNELLLLKIIPASGLEFSDVNFELTIEDNDVPAITFEADDNVDEGSDISLQITRENTEANTPELTIHLDITGTADSTDFSIPSLDVTFGEGVSSQTVTFSAIADETDEKDETVIISLQTSSNYEGGTKPSQTITINDQNDAKVKFKTPASLTITEGDAAVDITVKRINGDSTSPAVTVILTKTHVETSDSDFTFGTLEINIGDGQLEGTYTLTINDDEIHENPEHLKLSISATTGVEPVNPSEVTVTANDNDKSIVEVDLTKSVGEGDGTISIELRRTNVESNSPGVSGILSVQASNGKAEDTEDFASSSLSTFNFPSGASTISTTLDILEDEYDENDETFQLTLTESATLKKGAQNTIEITIIDNDDSLLEFPRVTYTVPEAVGSVILPVKRSNINGNAPSVDVTFLLEEGTAVAADYNLPTATATIAENADGVDIEVQIVNDQIDEPDQSFTIGFQTGNGVKAGTEAQAGVTIKDDDKPTFAFEQSTYNEDESNTLEVTVVRTDAVTGELTVDVEIEVVYTADEAVAADITSPTAPITLTFGGGVATKKFTITFNDDGIVEKDETYKYKIKSSNTYDIDTVGETTITINNNDVPHVEFDQSEMTVSEQAGSVVFMVKCTNIEANSPAFNVDLEVDSSSTLQVSEYVLPSPFAASFSIGDETASVTVTINDDELDEPAEETLVVVFSPNPEQYTPQNVVKLTVKTTDDDISLFSIHSTAYSVNEDEDLVITIDRPSPVGEVPVTVNFAVTHGTTEAADLGTVPTSVNFAAGESSKTITIPIIDDSTDEPDEDFTIVISPVADVYDIDTTGSTTATIVDNDVPIISLKTPSPTYESAGPLVLTATRTNGLIGEITVGIEIVASGSGTAATSGDDFTPPNPLEIVFADSETTKTIDFVLKDDITVEQTEVFDIKIVANPTVYGTDVQQVTATILDDDGPASFDCRRPGQNCENSASCTAGVCDCGSLTPKKVGYKCDYNKDDVNGQICEADSCTADFGTCISGGTAICSCEPGYVGDKCELPRYKVVCGDGKMSIQIDPIGNFVGKVYAYEHEDTCTFDDFDSQAGMPAEITGGKVKTIPNKDTSCGDTASVVIDNILRVSRIIYVQYNTNFQAVYDEFVRARCVFDLTNNAVLESVLSPVTSDQSDVVQATAHGDLNPLDLGVEKEGSPITDSTPISMGEQLTVVLSVTPAKDFGALLVDKITIDNNLPSDPIIIDIVKDSCFQATAAGIMSATNSLTSTTQNNILKIEFSFLPPKFKNSEELRIKVVAKICPVSDTSGCDLPQCGFDRRKRATDDNDHKAIDFVFKVSDPLSERQLADSQPIIIKEGSSPLDCANVISSGILAAIGMLSVLLLVFLVLSIVLLFRLMRRPNHSKAQDMPSSMSLPTKVVYS